MNHTRYALTWAGILLFCAVVWVAVAGCIAGDFVLFKSGNGTAEVPNVAASDDGEEPPLTVILPE